MPSRLQKIGLLVSMFDEEIELLGVDILDFGFVLWIAGMLLYFIKHVKRQK